MVLEYLATILGEQIKKLDSYITADIDKSNWIKELDEKQNKTKTLKNVGRKHWRVQYFYNFGVEKVFPRNTQNPKTMEKKVTIADFTT